jgi:hypothetical protein
MRRIVAAIVGIKPKPELAGSIAVGILPVSSRNLIPNSAAGLKDPQIRLKQRCDNLQTDLSLVRVSDGKL